MALFAVGTCATDRLWLALCFLGNHCSRSGAREKTVTERWISIGDDFQEGGLGSTIGSYFAYGRFAEQHELDTATRFRWGGCSFGHVDGVQLMGGLAKRSQLG